MSETKETEAGAEAQSEGNDAAEAATDEAVENAEASEAEVPEVGVSACGRVALHREDSDLGADPAALPRLERQREALPLCRESTQSAFCHRCRQANRARRNAPGLENAIAHS